MVGPGTINYVEGQASIDGAPLTPESVGTARIRAGDAVDTHSGFVEILLTPGTFLRLGHNSEIRLLSSGLAETRIQLAHGEAMLEADQLIKGTNLEIEMNGATMQVERKGLIDCDTAANAIRVLDGKATVAEGGRTQTLGKHDQVLLASKHPLKRRNFNEKKVETNSLYVWSKARSAEEAQASEESANNALYYATAGPGWYWDPYWDFYGFWPYDGFLSSPFGWGFYSPAFFGYYGGYGWYGGHRGWHGWGGWHGGWHGHGGWDRAGALHGGGFHWGGFHGGGFHGGGSMGVALVGGSTAAEAAIDKVATG